MPPISELTLPARCPSAYGEGSYPLIILAFTFLVNLFLSGTIFFHDVFSASLRRNLLKKLFLACAWIMCFLRSIMIIVPFQHSMFSNNFFCFGLPRYFHFSTYQVFCIWLDQTFTRRLLNTSPRKSFTAICIIINSIILVLQIVCSILQTFVTESITIQFPNLLIVIEIAKDTINLCFFVYSLIRLFKVSKVCDRLLALKWRARIFKNILIINIVINALRVTWDGLDIVGLNYFQRLWTLQFNFCSNSDANCAAFYWQYTFLYVMVDTLPLFLFLVSCSFITLTSRTQSAANNTRRITASNKPSQSKSATTKLVVRPISPESGDAFFGADQESEDSDRDQPIDREEAIARQFNTNVSVDGQQMSTQPPSEEEANFREHLDEHYFDPPEPSVVDYDQLSSTYISNSDFIEQQEEKFEPPEDDRDYLAHDD
ncbi:hypothetical protein BLNAU_18149 [Blattamonas nauphoetae]|uniref:Uncharacterized protein n=1 Tax=Blattamonas nauphoetae TaxID=2049346 RepID=A0ABQ9X593_9EUKA|nr:hypothetical protein BLNAU_18149 [Blattamonas nauphoetae]